MISRPPEVLILARVSSNPALSLDNVTAGLLCDWYGLTLF
jgi:hypothetical protein